MVQCIEGRVFIKGEIDEVMAECAVLVKNVCGVLKRRDSGLYSAFVDGMKKTLSGEDFADAFEEEKEEKKPDADILEAVSKILDELKTMREEK